MRMFKNQSLFALTQDGESPIYWQKIHHDEMFECLHRSILCPAQGCKFINNMETVILHFINSPYICYIPHSVNHYAMCQILLMITM